MAMVHAWYSEQPQTTAPREGTSYQTNVWYIKQMCTATGNLPIIV